MSPSTNRSPISALRGPRAVAALGALAVALVTLSFSPAKANAAAWVSFPVTINNRSDLDLTFVEREASGETGGWTGDTEQRLVPEQNWYVPVGTELADLSDRWPTLTARYSASWQGRKVDLDLGLNFRTKAPLACTLLFVEDRSPVPGHACEGDVLRNADGWRSIREVRFTITGKGSGSSGTPAAPTQRSNTR
jgi:hypothetical protein